MYKKNTCMLSVHIADILQKIKALKGSGQAIMYKKRTLQLAPCFFYAAKQQEFGWHEFCDI